MKVLVYEPQKGPYVKEIPNKLKPMQHIVGGPIETVRFTDELIIICNEEGRLNHLPENRIGIVGTFFVCADDDDQFRGLTDVEIAHLEAYFK